MTLSRNLLKLALATTTCLALVGAGAAVGADFLLRPQDTSGAVLRTQVYTPAGMGCDGLGCGHYWTLASRAPSAESDALIRVNATVSAKGSATMQLRAFISEVEGDGAVPPAKLLSPGTVSSHLAGDTNMTGSWRMPSVPAGSSVRFVLTVRGSDTTRQLVTKRPIIDVQYSAS